MNPSPASAPSTSPASPATHPSFPSHPSHPTPAHLGRDFPPFQSSSYSTPPHLLPTLVSGRQSPEIDAKLVPTSPSSSLSSSSSTSSSPSTAQAASSSLSSSYSPPPKPPPPPPHYPAALPPAPGPLAHPFLFSQHLQLQMQRHLSLHEMQRQLLMKQREWTASTPTPSSATVSAPVVDGAASPALSDAEEEDFSVESSGTPRYRKTKGLAGILGIFKICNYRIELTDVG